MILTVLERKRFVEWLRQDAASTRLLFGQIDKLSLPPAIADELKKRHSAEIVAAEFIAKKLEQSESQTLSAGGAKCSLETN